MCWQLLPWRTRGFLERANPLRGAACFSAGRHSPLIAMRNIAERSTIYQRIDGDDTPSLVPPCRAFSHIHGSQTIKPRGDGGVNPTRLPGTSCVHFSPGLSFAPSHRRAGADPRHGLSRSVSAGLVGPSAAIYASACAFRLCDDPQVCRRPPYCARRKPAAGLRVMARSHKAGYALTTR